MSATRQSLGKLGLILSICAIFGCAGLNPLRWLFGQSAIEDRWGSAPKREAVEEGLRDALRVGTQRAVSEASRASGFGLDPRIRIGSPQPLRAFASAAREIGIPCQIDALELDMNRAAESVAAEAIGVFGSEIRALSLPEPLALLNGGPSAATDQFRKASSARLVDQLVPLVTRKMQQHDLYRACGELDTRLRSSHAASPGLARHVAQGTVAGLFVLLAEEEARIRKDPAARTTRLLREVFDSPEQ